MGGMEAEVSVHGGTPESRDLYAKIQRAIGLTERLNRIPFADGDAIREAWSELTGTAVDRTFSLIPPVYSEHGRWLAAGSMVLQGVTVGEDSVVAAGAVVTRGGRT